MSILVGCAKTPAPQKPAEVESPPKKKVEQPNITIENVEIANPLIVTGRARTFENNVILRARDAKSSLITETFTTSEGEMGRHNRYRATLWLTRHPGDRVTVEALEYSAKDGSEQSLMSVERSFGVEAVEVTLHLPDPDCTRVVAHRRVMPKSISMARLLVEALMTEEHFPKGSEVRSINLRDGVLTVDFNERLQNVGGSCRAQMIRASVTETLMQLPTVKKVVITAAGGEKLALQP